jgi:23S rRNA pseudouridine1911/1915/1917 synthase
MPQHTLTVDQENHHTRLDVFLVKNFPEAPSRTFVQKLIDDGQVQVNQKAVKPGYQVAEGDKVTVHMPDEIETWQDVKAEKIPLDIFYEDPYFLVINKPAGMMVHPATGCNTGTLVNALLHHCQNLSDRGENFRPGIVHRLDRETSGLIVVAKDNRSHVILGRQFEKHKIKKRYIALVEGDIVFDEGVIEVPLGRHPRFFDKKAVSYDGTGKEAKTIYRVLKRSKDKSKTLVALFPESGRTHQLRVHMLHLGQVIGTHSPAWRSTPRPSVYFIRKARFSWSSFPPSPKSSNPPCKPSSGNPK